MTLLKNTDNILPLAKNKKVLVTGPTADSLISLNNGWTCVWQGSEPSLYPTDKMTIQQAIEAKSGKRISSSVPARILRSRPEHSGQTATPTDYRRRGQYRGRRRRRQRCRTLSCFASAKARTPKRRATSPT